MKIVRNQAARYPAHQTCETIMSEKWQKGINKRVLFHTIRNKMIHWVPACVRDGRKQEENDRPVLVELLEFN